jgi:hypothetical protein
MPRFARSTCKWQGVTTNCRGRARRSRRT